MEQDPNIKLLLESLKFEVGNDYFFCFFPDSSLLYAYGENVSGHLGLGNEKKNASALVQVPNIVGKIQQVITAKNSFFTNYTFVLTDQGLFACGENDYGQLGLGYKGKKISTFTQVHNTVGKIQQVNINFGSTFVLTDQGLFACGRNDRGKMGLGEKEEFLTFTQIPNIPGKIQQIIATSCNTFLLTDHGLFACGENDYGQLGLGHNRIVKTFTKVPNIIGNIQQIVNNNRSTFVLTDQGLYACGNNYAHQLGLDTTKYLNIKEVYDFVQVPKLGSKIQQIIITDKSKFSTLPAGSYDSTFVLTEQGLFACGDNWCGKLGLGKDNTYSTFTFTPVSKVTGRVYQVITDSEDTLVLTDQGLFTCGNNERCQLGLNHTNPVSTLTQLHNVPGKIKKMLNRNFIQTEEEIYFRYNLSDTEIIFRDQNIYRFKAIDLSALKPPIELQLNKEANKFVPVSKVQAPIKLSPAYLCPLSHQIMLDPVMAGDGYTYEREEIQKALALKPISPLTNEALEDTRLTPNHAIRSAIAELLIQHSELWDENNAHGETVYFSTGLQQQAITALHNGTSDSLKRYLERDPRLLVRSTATTVNFLELACQQGSFETLKVVLNAMKQAAWEKILKQTNVEILLQLCSRHLGIEAAQLLGNHLGWTVKEYQEQAYKAIAQGDKQLLSACLMAGISVNMLDAKKWSLLHYAAKDGQIPIVIYLIQAGADAKLKNDEGLKAAQVARVFKHETTAQAIEAEQFKAKLKLLNLHSGSVDTSISLLPQINQLQEQVDHLVKTVQQLQAEVVFLKEQLKVTSTHNIPLLGSQLPTFSSTLEINNDNYPKKFFGNN